MTSNRPPRRGRRDNGLDASTFVPLADVDPRVGEHLLDVLKLAGVPAYLDPSADVEPYTRALALPSPPTDRLWVDRDQRAAAREIVEAELGVPRPPSPPAGDDEPSRGLADADEERAWRDIVEGFGRDAASSPVPPWPVEEDAAPERTDRQRDPDSTEEYDELWSRPAAGPSRGTPEGAEDDEDDEGHYEPPVPPPVPRLSKHAILAIMMIAAGAVLIVAPGAVGFDTATGFTLGVLAVVSAAAVLVWRLGERGTGDGDGPDDGAVV